MFLGILLLAWLLSVCLLVGGCKCKMRKDRMKCHLCRMRKFYGKIGDCLGDLVCQICLLQSLILYFWPIKVKAQSLCSLRPSVLERGPRLLYSRGHRISCCPTQWIVAQQFAQLFPLHQRNEATHHLFFYPAHLSFWSTYLLVGKEAELKQRRQ